MSTTALPRGGPRTRSVSRRLSRVAPMADIFSTPPSSCSSSSFSTTTTTTTTKRRRKVVAPTRGRRRLPSAAVPAPFSTLPNAVVCHALTWCDIRDMMRVAQVSRPLRAAAQRPTSWHAVQMLGLPLQRRVALRTLVRDLPAALRSARSVAVVVCGSWGFCSIPELCYHACAHVDIGGLPLGMLALCQTRPGTHRLQLLRLSTARHWDFAGDDDDDDAADRWRLDAESGEWKSTTPKTASDGGGVGDGGNDGDDADGNRNATTLLPDDTLIRVHLSEDDGYRLRLVRHDDEPAVLRSNATMRRLQLRTSAPLAGLNARLLARAFPRLAELVIRNGSVIDVTQVPQFLRLVFGGLRELRRLELSTDANPYVATLWDPTALTHDSRVERRRRTVDVPRRLQSLVLATYRTRQPYNCAYERSARASGAFLALPRDADVALERLHLDAALAALTPLVDSGDDGDRLSPSSPRSSSSATSNAFLPHLTDLALTSGCLLARSDLGRMLRLPTLRTVRLAAMGLVAHSDWHIGDGGGGGGETLCPTLTDLALADCEVSLDFLRDIVALYTGLQTFRVSDALLESHDTVDVNGAMRILSESTAFRTGALRRVHFPHVATVRFASPAPMPRTGVSCSCQMGGCVACVCVAAGVRCGHECHVPRNVREYETLSGSQRKAADRVNGVACCTNADWPAGETSSDTHRSGVVPTRSVWLSRTSSVDLRWTATVLPPADVADTRLATRPPHLAFVEDAYPPAVDSWRIDALMYSESLATLVGAGSRCVVSFGVYRDTLVSDVADGGDNKHGDADAERKRKQDCVYPRCFCRSSSRVWKPNLGAVAAAPPPTFSSSSSSSGAPTRASNTATANPSVRTKRGGSKRPVWVHTVSGAGLVEATLASASSSV